MTASPDAIGLQSVPWQIGDLLALMGDAVDGSPGVSKIGSKTAAAKLQIHGNLDHVISNADKLTGQAGANPRNGIAMASLSRELVSFTMHTPLGLNWRSLAQNHRLDPNDCMCQCQRNELSVPPGRCDWGSFETETEMAMT